MRENLIGGGRLVRVVGASGLAVEGVSNAKRGLVVQSERCFVVSGNVFSGRYQLTRRAVNGTDLWRVRRIEPAKLS